MTRELQASPLIRVPAVMKRARTAVWKGPLARGWTYPTTSLKSSKYAGKALYNKANAGQGKACRSSDKHRVEEKEYSSMVQ